MNQPLSRRRFLKNSVATAAAAGLGSRFLTAQSYAAVAGANEDIRIGVIGFNGRGNSHIDAYKKMKGVRLVALCDADQAVLDKGLKALSEPPKANKPKATTRPTTRQVMFMADADAGAAGDAPAPSTRPVKADGYTDLRKLLDNKDIDAVSTATPNHWHALISVWACQAGKDVYVEKPVSHNVWEGRKIIEASRKYNRIVQAGTQSRSSESIRQSFEWVRAGNLGKIQVARGLCYKRRGSIGKTEGPGKVPGTVNYDLWLGPAPKEDPHRKQFHYDWHWFWAYGNGDLGNQGIHQMDIARWALGKDTLSPKVISVGGRFGYEDDGQTPNTLFVVHDYNDSLLIFEVRGLWEKDGGTKMDTYKGQDVGHIIECEGGYLSGTTAYDKNGKEVKTFHESGEDHFGNFIKAVRSRKREDQNAEIVEGHLSSALCHTGNISYRLGAAADPNDIKDAFKADKAATETFERFQQHLAANEVDLKMDKATLGVPLRMDPKTERFIDNPKADALLVDPYRKPFVVPENV